jgi:glycosyltransferase involved in cell wall biosynthesis
MSSPADGRTPVVVVASWFPTVDDTSRGRFVADQVAALATGGRTAPRVVSFETIMLTGETPERQAQAGAMESLVGPALTRDGRTFSASGMHGPAGVALARIPVGAGWPGLSSAYPVPRRAIALRSVAGSLGDVRIVHAHTAFPDGAASIELAQRLDVPLVITEHASFVASILADPPRRRDYEAAVGAAARVITVSRTLGDELAAAIPSVREKLVVIPNTVDVAAFSAGPAAARRDDQLLYVGYRLETKGIPVLLSAFRVIRRERPTATLRLIGRSRDEATERSWHDLARELDVADAVSFEPPALRPAVAEAMARASVLVHASPRETFGMTAVEALAAGTPVVAADSGGVTETLAGDPALGEIVPRDDPDALARAVLRTLDRRGEFDPAYLRASAVSRFGAESVAARLADLYDEVLAAQPAAVRQPGRVATTRHPVPALPRRTLIVGFTTTRTQTILSAMPAAALADVHVLCARVDKAGRLPLPDDDVTIVDLDEAYRRDLGSEFLGRRPSIAVRIRRVIRDPLGVVRRRRIKGRRAAYRLEAARAALAAAMASITPEDLPRLDVVAVDGVDFHVVSLVPAAAERLTPGALRWFADQHASRAAGDAPAPGDPSIG